MHRVIEQSLEEYLDGSAAPEFTAHLRACEQCRREVLAIQETSTLFGELRSAEIFESSPVFTARLMAKVGERRVAVAGFWSILSLDPTFGRRMVLASLLVLGVIGSYLVNQERDYSPGPPSVEVVMAHENTPETAPVTDHEDMLVKLTSYEP